MAYDRETVENWFIYHPATDETGPKHDEVRNRFMLLACSLYDLLPDGPDRTYALRKIQEAMWATNAAVANARVPA